MRDEDGRRFDFVFDGRGWAVTTLALAAVLGYLTQTEALARETLALWFFRILAVLMFWGFVSNLGSRVTVRVDRATGRITCSGTWAWRRVAWERTARDFTEVRVERGWVDGGPASNMHIVLAARKGRPLLFRTRGFFESCRHAIVLGLAKRLGDALQLPVSDHS